MGCSGVPAADQNTQERPPIHSRELAGIIRKPLRRPVLYSLSYGRVQELTLLRYDTLPTLSANLVAVAQLSVRDALGSSASA